MVIYASNLTSTSLVTFLSILTLLLSTVSAYTELLHPDLVRLKSTGVGARLSLDPTDKNNHLFHFNRTRVPGTEGSLYAREYIKSHFAQISEKTGAQWHVEEDVFEERGFNFSNIVATIAPDGVRTPQYLVLSVHYDSKIVPEGFIGAIDSAVSCGILLDLAETISPSLAAAFSDEDLEIDMGLKIIFFDGEEAIETWTDEDSIYGARHLHSQWKAQKKLGSIDLLVLLDLLGATDNNYIPSYFPQSQTAYAELSTLERRLAQVFPELIHSGNMFLAEPSYTFEREYFGTIGDDHLPFLHSGVPVLHMITHRFPQVWHTINDDFLHVDIVAIRHWCVLFTAFTLEYLDVSPV